MRVSRRPPSCRPSADAARIKIRYDLHASPDEMFGKLREGNPGCDVIFPSSEYVQRMIAFAPDTGMSPDPRPRHGRGPASERLPQRCPCASLARREAGITFVLASHDREEALSMVTEIAVTREVAALQVAPPRELYEQPRCRFAAGVIGSMRLLPVRVPTACEVALGPRPEKRWVGYDAVDAAILAE